MAPVSSSDSMAIRLLVICFVFPSLATVAVFGRFWARHIKNTHLKANDYLVLVALVCYIVHCTYSSLTLTSSSLGASTSR